MGKLEAKKIKEVWRILKGWHREAGGPTAKPCTIGEADR